jgi:hypothetical protein
MQIRLRRSLNVDRSVAFKSLSPLVGCISPKDGQLTSINPNHSTLE